MPVDRERVTSYLIPDAANRFALTSFAKQAPAKQTLIMSVKRKLSTKRLSSADAKKIKGFLLAVFVFLLMLEKVKNLLRRERTGKRN